MHKGATPRSYYRLNTPFVPPNLSNGGIFLRMFFLLSIYIERRKNVHIPYYLTRLWEKIKDDVFERIRNVVGKMKKIKFYLSKTEKLILYRG